MRAVIVGAIVVVVAGLTVSNAVNYYSQTETITSTITSTEIKRAGDEDKYLVYTPYEVFENVDDVWLGKYDSSDVQNRATQAEKNAQVCDFDVVGYRSQQFTVYRNISSLYNCRPLPNSPKQ